MIKKVAIIGTVGLPAKYGGFETLVEYITKELNQNFDLTVYCSAKSYSERLETYNNCKLEYINFEANGIQSIIYDIRAIFHALKYADVLLILGVSGCVILPVVKLFSKKKIIVNIDGLEWKREKWNGLAKRFLKFSEACAVKYATAIIADNKVIKDYVISNYKKNALLIPYGGDHCTLRTLSDEVLTSFPFLNKKYAFKVCRIEPENNVEMILKAFSKSNKMALVLVGNWSNSEFGRQMKLKYMEFDHIHLLDPIYNQSVLNEIRSNCYFYVHGHSAGGTNPSLVEAMSLGLPIITFDVDYNRETTNNKAIYFGNTDQLVKIIDNVTKTQLSENSKQMKNEADAHYVWKSIAMHYKNLLEL